MDKPLFSVIAGQGVSAAQRSGVETHRLVRQTGAGENQLSHPYRRHKRKPDSQRTYPKQASVIYADEADVLNAALFGVTDKEWRDKNPALKGNIRDYANINELICLSNMENINAVNDGIGQHDRLLKLNKIAIQQMTILSGIEKRKLSK